MKDIIVWWSAGATSAVATKLAISKYGKERCKIIYFPINTAHIDNERFIKDCEKWYGLPIIKIGSEKYEDQFDVIEKTKYVNGAKGARCTMELKRLVREKIEKTTYFKHQVFGFENIKKEIVRSERIPKSCNALFPLIENKLTKENCLKILSDNNIDLPAMYRLGYPNNNCIGCVKGGMGYWNKIRIDFPETFERMTILERKIGRSCLKDENGNRLFLDELDKKRGRNLKILIPDCGFFCGDEGVYL